MLEANIPEEVESPVKEILSGRYPNYCHECGGEVVLAGGWQRLTPGKGLWYEHIDAVLMCERGCWKQMFMSGLDKEASLDYYQDGTDGYESLFSDVIGYCEHHGQMQTTKDINGVEGPLRQWKCPECERGMAALYTGEVETADD